MWRFAVKDAWVRVEWITWRRTTDSLDGKRANDAARTSVFNMIVGRFLQILRATEEICEETTRPAGFGNGLLCGESLGVFSI